MRSTKRDIAFRLRKWSLPILAVLFLAGCDDDDEMMGTDLPGGGDGGDAANVAPIASFTANPTSIPAGDNHQTIVTLDASGSSDPDGDPLSFQWTVQAGRFESGSTDTDQTIQVSFPGVAPYNVTLVVEDGRGASDEARTVINVG